MTLVNHLTLIVRVVSTPAVHGPADTHSVRQCNWYGSVVLTSVPRMPVEYVQCASCPISVPVPGFCQPGAETERGMGDRCWCVRHWCCAHDQPRQAHCGPALALSIGARIWAIDVGTRATRAKTHAHAHRIAVARGRGDTARKDASRVTRPWSAFHGRFNRGAGAPVAMVTERMRSLPDRR